MHLGLNEVVPESSVLNTFFEVSAAAKNAALPLMFGVNTRGGADSVALDFFCICTKKQGIIFLTFREYKAFR